MNFYDLFELSQLRAIELAITPTLHSVWLMKCRDYSQRFHTPLDRVVNELDPLFVLDALNQDKYHPSIVDEELEQLIETLQRIKDPNLFKHQ